jgi:hypothetical protein
MIRILFAHVEGPSEALLRTRRQLRRGVHGQLRTIPHCHSGMRFHRRLVLIGRGVGCIDLDGSAGEGRVKITYGTVGWIGAADAARIDRRRTRRAQIIRASEGRIANVHPGSSRCRLLKRVGNDKGDGKPEIRDVIVIERRHRACEAIRQINRTKRMLRRRIVLVQHEPHARRILRILHVHRGDAAFGERGRNDDAVKGGALRSVFVCIGRLTRYLEAAVDTIEGESDRIGESACSHCRVPQMVPVTSAKAARSVRRASGILKSLWP